MEKLVIKRSEWLRGSSADSMLYNAKLGTFCCLGIYGRDNLGYTKEALCSVLTPTTMDKYPDWMQQCTSTPGGLSLVNRIMNANDQYLNLDTTEAQLITDAEREAKLTELFAKGNIEVQFVD